MKAKARHFSYSLIGLAALALLAAIILWPAAVGAQGSSPPHRFGGTASLDDEPVSQGTQIAAIIGGLTVATTTANNVGSYIISVPVTTGQTIGFTIGSYAATQTATATPGRVEILNLTGSTAGSTVTPAPTPTAGPTPTPDPNATATPTPAPTATSTTAATSTTSTPAATLVPAAPAATPETAATPIPEATPAPAVAAATTAPAPAGASTFRVGPTVNLRPVNDLIDQDKDGLVEALFRNPALNDNPMVVDLSVSMPAGFHVYGEGFASDTAAGTASGSFTVLPGQSVTIFLNVKSEKVGTFTVHFSGVYWPEGNKDRFNPISLTHPFMVRSPSLWPLLPPTSTPAPGQVVAPQAGAPAATAVPAPVATAVPAPAATAVPAGGGDPQASCSLAPEGSSANGAGDMALLALPLAGLAGLVFVGRRKRGG